jgi:hypothetical protein
MSISKFYTEICYFPPGEETFDPPFIATPPATTTKSAVTKQEAGV